MKNGPQGRRGGGTAVKAATTRRLGQATVMAVEMERKGCWEKENQDLLFLKGECRR